jgi:hypothetical protein
LLQNGVKGGTACRVPLFFSQKQTSNRS